MENRILEISKKHGLSHIGSCLSVLPILKEIYEEKGANDFVLMSNAHSHLAHLVVMEYNKEVDNIEGLLKDYGIHCDIRAGCDASGGSLGHAIGIGIGLAIANPSHNIYCVISDGSFHEGSEMEALRIANQLSLTNLKIYANFNGYSAVAKLDLDYLERIIKGLGFPVKVYRTSNGVGFDGVSGHYVTL